MTENISKNNDPVLLKSDSFCQTNGCENKPDGLVQELDENGNLKRETSYVNGIRHGWRRTYHSNGYIFKEVFFVLGRKHGFERGFYPNGTLSCEIPYRSGRLHGTMRLFYQNGTCLNETEYKDGLRNGFERWYFKDGVIDEIPYSNDYREGIQITIIPQKKLKIKTLWHMGKKNGHQQLFELNSEMPVFERADV